MSAVRQVLRGLTLATMVALGAGAMLIAGLAMAQSPPAAFGGAAPRDAAPPAFSGAPPQSSPRQAAPLQARGPFGRVLTWVAQTQQKMQRGLVAAIKQMKSGNAFQAGLWLALGSFAYGIVHAAGPGHGKAIISSYVLANEETVRRGILISFLAAAVQGMMAIALVGILVIAFKGTGFQVTAWVRHLETASYALVFAVGFFLLLSVLRRLWHRWRASVPDETAHQSHADHGHTHDHKHNHDHNHGHDHGHNHEDCEACGHIVNVSDIAGPMSWRKMAAVVFAVGIRPCSGAVVVLIFALAQGLFWAGVAATFAMAFGTAITVSVLATLALGSRQLVIAAGHQNTRWVEAVWTICAVGGALLVMVIGLLLFLASLGPARPF